MKAKLKFIDKRDEPGSPAMDRGGAIHKLAEDFINSSSGRPVLPEELEKFKAEFRKLQKMMPDDIAVEGQWAYYRDWSQADWWDKKCWLRIKVDVAFRDAKKRTTLHVWDWKTGKIRADNQADYMEQLELYALGAMLRHEDVEEVRPVLMYLDAGVAYPPKTEPLIYTRDDIPELREVWEKRVEPMLTDTMFAPRPNQFCRWCAFRKEAGGPCSF